MTNHPNRKITKIVYSTATSHVLGRYTGRVKNALADVCAGFKITDEFLVVFTTSSTENMDRFDFGRWPADAKIIWRGADDFAQNYRR